MSKHTPGPWTVMPRGWVSSDFGRVALVHDCNDREKDANATLIAAAPTMFDALLWAERRLKGDDTEAGRTVLKKVQDALDMADGGLK